MLTKINVLKLVKRHLQTLRDADAKRVSALDIFLFYVVPLFAAFSMTVWPFDVELRSVDTLLTVATVLFGFLTTVYLFVVERMSIDSVRKPEQARLLRETQANVGYASLLLLALMCVLFAQSTFVDSPSGSTTAILHDGQDTNPVIEWLVYYLTIHFALTMLMIIKRVDGIASVESGP